MTIPVVTRLEDWRFALYDLAAGTKVVLNPDMVIDPQVEVVPGVGMERLKSCTFEIPFLANARAAFDFDNLQLLCIDRWGDSTKMLWGVVQKPKEGYSQRVKRDSVQVVATQVEELLKCRKVVQYIGSEAAAITAVAYPDDFAKLLVTTCFTGNDLDGNSRAWEWGTLNVDADASQCADTADLIVLSAPEQEDTLYKRLDDLARAYDFDFQLQVSVSGGAFTFTFKTQAPYGGSDLTTGASRVTIKDLYNLVPNAVRYRDASFRATRMYTRGYKLNVEDAAEIAKWGVWEGVAEGIKLSDAEIALEKARVKEGAEYGYEATAANGQMALWCEHFKAGDKVNRVNNRLGIAADSEKIAAVTARFQNKVMAVTIRWGDREPGATDRQGGGAYNPLEEYGTVVKDTLPVGNTASPGVDPMHEVYGDHIHLLSLTADDAGVMTLTAGVGYIAGANGIATSIVGGKLVVDGLGLWSGIGFYGDDDPAVYGHLDANHRFGVKGGTGAAVTVAADPDDTWLTINTVWDRDDANGYLFPATLTDHVLIGRNDQAGAHALGTTYLDVNGDVRVGKYVYATAAALTLYGAGGVVDVYNNASACQVNIYNAGNKKVHLESNGSSWFRGGVHTHGHSFTIYDTDSESGGTEVGSWSAPDGALTISGGGDLTIQAAGDTKFAVDGATGNTTWKAGAQMTWEGVAYRMPTSAPGGAGYALVATPGSPNQLSWSATTTAAAHNLLSATHGDTTAGTAVAGDIIIADATPKWTRLAKGAQYKVLMMGASLPAWSDAVYSVGLSAPAQFTVSGSPVTTTGTLALAWQNQAANTVLAGPATGAAAAPTFRALVAADIPSLSATYVTSVTAGDGLTGGGTGGAVTLNVGAGNGISVTADAVALGALSSSWDAGAYTIQSDYFQADVRADVYELKFTHGTAAGLKSDVEFRLYTVAAAAQTMRAAGIQVSSSYSGSIPTNGVLFGVDTNLYRSAADTLKTDDALYVTGQIIAAASTTSIACSGNVTLVDGKTVDGVDISAWKSAYDTHTHNYIKPVGYHAAGYDGDLSTGVGVQTGDYTQFNCSYSSDGSTLYYVYTATTSGGGSAGWRYIYLRSKEHYHSVSYDTVASAAP